MKFLVVVSCLLAIAYAKPGVVAPVAYTGYVPGSFGYSYSSHVAAPVAYAAPAAYAAPYAYAAHTFAAPVAHSAVVAPVARAAVVAAPAAHAAVVAPVAHAVAPVAVGVEKSQYHAQDTFGQAAYGHAEAFQTHNAVQDASGNKIGSYSYVAPSGQVIAANYVADALGYRVATNAAPVESPEVVAARAAHLAEVEVTKHRSRRGIGYSVPVAYSAPVVAPYHAAPVVAGAYSSHVVAAPHAYAYRYY